MAKHKPRRITPDNPHAQFLLQLVNSTRDHICELAGIKDPAISREIGDTILSSIIETIFTHTKFIREHVSGHGDADSRV